MDRIRTLIRQVVVLEVTKLETRKKRRREVAEKAQADKEKREQEEDDANATANTFSFTVGKGARDDKSQTSSPYKNRTGGDSPPRSTKTRAFTEKDSQADTMSITTGYTARSPKKGTIADLLEPRQPDKMINFRKEANRNGGGGGISANDIAKMSRGGSRAGGSIATKSIAGASQVTKSQFGTKSRKSRAESVKPEDMDIFALDQEI